jgi:hypothetical protein
MISRTRNETLWSIATPDFPKAKNISTILYGVVPEGFTGKPAVPLKPGEIIEVSVHGAATSNSQHISLNK